MKNPGEKVFTKIDKMGGSSIVKQFLFKLRDSQKMLYKNSTIANIRTIYNYRGDGVNLRIGDYLSDNRA